MTFRLDDNNTKCLIHFGGADATTTFIDESGKVWTATGNAQIDTAQYKFGGSAGLFDGTGDSITSPDSPDWRLSDGVDANKWTLDLWLRWAVDPGTAIVGIIQQKQADTDFWVLRYYNNSMDYIIRVSNINQAVANAGVGAFNPAANTWYHIAVVKNGTAGYGFFVNGTLTSAGFVANTYSEPDYAGGIRIADFEYPAATHYYFNGWMDEVRISKGIARWTANFTPPARQYMPLQPVQII